LARTTVCADRREVSAGLLCTHVLIQTEVGKAGQVAQAIRASRRATAEDIAGPYDVIARVQAPRMKELGSARIQGVDGVTAP